MNQSTNNNNSKPTREELQAKLREKIGMKTLQRRSTKSKLNTLNETQKNADNSVNIEELQAFAQEYYKRTVKDPRNMSQEDLVKEFTKMKLAQQPQQQEQQEI